MTSVRMDLDITRSLPVRQRRVARVRLWRLGYRHHPTTGGERRHEQLWAGFPGRRRASHTRRRRHPFRGYEETGRMVDERSTAANVKSSDGLTLPGGDPRLWASGRR